MTVGLDTVATLITIMVGVVGLGATTLATSRRNRIEVKRDIADLHTELKGDIADLRTELKADIAGLRTEVKGDIAELRTDLRGDIAELRTDLKGDIGRLDDRVYALAAGLAPRLAPSGDQA